MKVDNATGGRYFRAPGGLTALNDDNCVACCGPCAPGAKPGDVMEPFMVNPDYNFTEIWFDDSQSMVGKYRVVHDSGCRGFGLWMAGSTQLLDPNISRDMW